MDEEIVLEEDKESLLDHELRKLEFQEWEKEWKNQLCIKELELRECELSIQLNIKELEVAKIATNSAGKLKSLTWASTFALYYLFKILK